MGLGHWPTTAATSDGAASRPAGIALRISSRRPSVSAAVTYQPILATILNSFYSTPRGRRPAVFIGLDHYETMIADPVFWKAVVNNLVYAITTVPLSMGIGASRPSVRSAWPRW